jgi:biotin transport system substrate-specific component
MHPTNPAALAILEHIGTTKELRMQTGNPALSAPRFGALTETLPGRATLAVAASLFVALSAHLSVPLPFTPVPLTFSDLAVLLVGLALGPTTAFAALVLYLLEGAAGLPVFSPYGLPGIARLLGPTGGYLLAYPFAAALAGLAPALATRTSKFVAALGACTAASALIMLCGVAWMIAHLHLAPLAAFTAGAAPFLYGQVVKIVAAAGIFSAFPRRTRA